MPGREIPRELQEHEEEIVARAVAALSRQVGYPLDVASDPDANLARNVRRVVDAVEPMIAAITLRAFAFGIERASGELPDGVRTGVQMAVSSARSVAADLERRR